MGPQVELRSKGFVGDNGGADANSPDGDDVTTAVLYEQVHLILEFLGVIQVRYDAHRQLGVGGDHSFTGFDPPARAFASL